MAGGASPLFHPEVMRQQVRAFIRQDGSFAMALPYFRWDFAASIAFRIPS
jgi:hypothetical protein